MKIRIIILSFFTALFFFGCSGGYLYTSKPALEFKDIDYGFAVKKSTSNPSLAYIDEGKGPQTIVLVHGLASNAGFWRYNIAELSKTYRVIAVDLPGYGKSQKGPLPYSLTYFAESIKNLLNELKIDKVVFVGHSMGGQTGIHFAINYPERVSKLILAAPAGIEPFTKGQGDWLKSVITIKGVKTTPEEGIRKNLAMNFYNWDEKNEWMVEERTRMVKADEFDEFCYTVTRSVAAMVDQPTSKRLGEIKVPTLVIYGKYDGLIPNMYLNPGFPADVFKIAQAKIPNCILHEIDNAGHMVMMEKPVEFNSAILDYLSK